MSTIKDFAAAVGLSAGMLGVAYAALPPASDAAKEQAKEAAAKGAWSDKVAAYKLCQVQDQVAERYRKDQKGEGKTAPAPMTSASCADPGPFTAVAHKPLESSEAHSPPGNATSPPSTNATAAELQGTKKPK